MSSDHVSHNLDSLPDFALKYAPLVYLHATDKYLPGNPVEHLSHTTPKVLLGDEVSVAEEHKGKVSMLSLPEVNKPDVFLTLNKDVRQDPEIPELFSSHCKPDEQGKSASPAFIICKDKTSICGGQGGPCSIVDVFYFFFYPYNEGNVVLFKHFGNHVGDWEHAMIRFRDGVPEAIHLSAHCDGNAWKWDLFEKKGDRPIIYSAGGSHAMYPKKGTHNYSGIFFVGPQDHTSTGHLWDPTLNFVTARCDGSSSEYTAISCNAPGLNTTIPPSDVVTILCYEGRWGNSFSDLRKPRQSTGSTIKGLTKRVVSKFKESSDKALEKAEVAAVNGEGPAAAEQAKTNGGTSLSPYQKLSILIWAEGPTGPRDKSLERPGMNRWEKRELLKAF